jgi:hypothetical protein
MNKDAIVVLHGYGMGSGFYWLNWFEVGKIAGESLLAPFFHASGLEQSSALACWVCEAEASPCSTGACFIISREVCEGHPTKSGWPNLARIRG